MSKKPYAKPRVIELGTVEELTEQVSPFANCLGSVDSIDPSSFLPGNLSLPPGGIQPGGTCLPD